MRLKKTLRRAFPDSTILAPRGTGVMKVNRELDRDVFAAVVPISAEMLRWPTVCSVCGAESCTRLTSNTIQFAKGQIAPSPWTSPPACATHEKSSSFVMCIPFGNTCFAWAHAFSRSKEFLTQLQSLNERHSPPPPWVLFPNRDPLSSWSQGVEQYYLEQLWLPYWHSLTGAQRQRALDEHRLPTCWESWQQSPFWRSLLELPGAPQS